MVNNIHLPMAVQLIPMQMYILLVLDTTTVHKHLLQIHLVDANVQPDDRTSFEFGVEAKAFNNRVGIEASYYQYTDGPQIFSKSISQTSGYASYVVNGTKTQRTGWDVTINGAVIKVYKRCFLGCNT